MNGSTISVKTGSEGPRHDLYHYEELTLTRSDGRVATIHTGLAEWMTYFDGQITRRFEDPANILASKFEAVMGISVKTLLKVPHQLCERKIRAHNRHDVRWVGGFPGESLLHCSTCGTVLDSYFNRSVVE